MFTQTPNPKQTLSEMISVGLHAFTIVIFGLFSLAATLHVALLLV